MTASAERIRTVRDVVRQIPLPKMSPPAAPAPQPELKIHTINHADPQQAAEVLKALVSGTVLVDAQAGQISINAVPSEQAKANLILQQLWIRASEKQLADMRRLLIRMGETGLRADAFSGFGRHTRVIPVGSDLESSLRQIQHLWPRIRKNPLRVLRPDG